MSVYLIPFERKTNSNLSDNQASVKVKVKVKQCHYRPRVAQRVPGSSQIT
jgi:hypothetical protein